MCVCVYVYVCIYVKKHTIKIETASLRKRKLTEVKNAAWDSRRSGVFSKPNIRTCPKTIACATANAIDCINRVALIDLS